MTAVHLLDRHDVAEALAGIDPVAVVRRVLALHAEGDVLLPAEACLRWRAPGGGPARSLNMPSYVGGEFAAAGTKVINANPANPARGLPRASGTTLLFDTETAEIRAILDAAAISATRTAAVTAVAAQLTAARPVASLALIGSGALAAAHLAVLTAALPHLRDVRLFDLDDARAAAFARDHAGDAAGRGVELRVAPTAEAAVAGADLVVPVTTTTTGYIPCAWLAPGAVVVHVSLDDLLPEVVLASGTLLVDDWSLVRDDATRLLGRMVRSGELVGPGESAPGARAVDAELGQVVLGRHPGRRTADEVVVVNPFGMSIADVALADRVRARACELGLGTEVAL